MQQEEKKNNKLNQMKVENLRLNQIIKEKDDKLCKLKECLIFLIDKDEKIHLFYEKI